MKFTSKSAIEKISKNIQKEKTSFEKSEELYQSNIVPILEILKPDEMSFEEYETKVKNELFEDVKTMQIARNELLVDPESNVQEVKDLLNTRVRIILEDYRNPNNKKEIDDDLVKKAKLVLLYQGDDSDLYKDIHESVYRNINLQDIKEHLTDIKKLSKTDIDILMKTPYSDLLSKNFERRFDFDEIAEGGTELFIEKLLANNTSLSDIKSVIARVPENSLSRDLFHKLRNHSSASSVAIKFAGNFKNIKVEDFLPDIKSDKDIFFISNLRKSNLDIKMKNEVLENIAINYISDSKKDSFYNLDFYLDESVVLNEKIKDALIDRIGYYFFSRVGATFIVALENVRKVNVSEDIIIKGINNGVKRSLLSNRESVIYNIPTTLNEIGFDLSIIYNDKESIKAFGSYFKNLFISEGSVDEDLVIKTIENLKVPKEILSLPEIQNIAESYILKNSLGYNSGWFKKWSNVFYFSQEKVAELKFNIFKKILTSNPNGFEEAIRLSQEDDFDKNSLERDNIQILSQNALIRYLSSGNIFKFEESIEALKISDEFLDSEDLINASKSSLLNSIELGGYESNVNNMIKTVSFEDDFFSSQEMIGAVENRFIKDVSRSSSREKHLELKLERYNVKSENINFEKIAEQAFEIVIEEPQLNSREKINSLIKEYKLDKEFVAKKTEEAILNKFKESSFTHYFEFKDLLKDSENFLKSPKAIESMNIGFIESIKKKYPGPVDFFYNNLPKEETEPYREEIKKIMDENIYDEVATAKLAMSRKPFDRMQKIINILPYENKAFETLYEIMGRSLDKEIYQEMQDLYNRNGIGEILQGMGVKSFGNDGARELKQAVVELKNKFTKIDFDPSELLDSSIKLNIFKAYTYFTESGWGNVNDESLKKIINKSLETAEQEAPFPESGIIYVDKLKQRGGNEKREYTSDFIDRFNLLLKDVNASKMILTEQNKPLSFLTEKISEKFVSIESTLREKLSETENEFAKENLKQKIELLQNINVRSIKDFQENFKGISQFKELESELRQIMFTFAFAKNRNYIEKNISEIDKENPNIDDISWLIDFIDHITNREVMVQYFTDKQSKRAFEKNINPKALIFELSKLQEDNTTDGKTSFKFIPSRNLLTEISGYTGSACWASKYNSIVEELPNMSSVTMVMNPDNKFERIAGSTMLIETQAENGDDLLIIRGLNPQENVINQLSVDDFYEKFMNYMKGVAEQYGKKLAISIDDHSGGHSTNRPVLFENIFVRKDSLERVNLKNPDEAKFNGYDISKNVYLVE